MLNIGSPESAFRYSFLPVDGVGLARMEFILAEKIRVHPLALIHYAWLKQKARRDAKLKELAESLSKERTVAENGAVLFVCNVCDNEKVYTFEEAVDLRFRCPVCNSMLTNLSESE